MSRKATQGALFKTHRRHYPVPENYPVDPSFIPDMPIETFHLETTGRLTPQDCAEYGWRQMNCATCDQPTAMFLNREPTPAREFKTAKRRLKDTGLVWGQDVSVICMCCSFRNCPHCMKHGELIMGHQPGIDGRCVRCGKLVNDAA